MKTRTRPRGLPAWPFAAMVTVAVLIAGSALFLSLDTFARGGISMADPVIAFRSTGALAIVAFGGLMLARGRNNRAAAMLGIILSANCALRSRRCRAAQGE